MYFVMSTNLNSFLTSKFAFLFSLKQNIALQTLLRLPKDHYILETW